jgi:hypothetical protein
MKKLLIKVLIDSIYYLSVPILIYQEYKENKRKVL